MTRTATAKARGKATTSSKPVPHRSNALIVPGLGVRAITPPEGTVELVEVTPGSLAELAGFRVGDVVKEVDGKAIRIAPELASLMGGKSVGSTVQIRYMVQGKWQSMLRS